MNNHTYSATLSNDSCIFDSAEGFSTARAAFAWAYDRFDCVCHISRDDTSTSGYDVHLSCNSSGDWFVRDFMDWVPVTLDTIAEYL